MSNSAQRYDRDLSGWVQGWYMPMTPDLTFYGSIYQIKVTGWTGCGAPQYDLNRAKKLPGPDNAVHWGGMGAQHGHGSVDGRYMLWNRTYGDDHNSVDCYDIRSGRFLWTYPSNFTGAHGSHRACGPQVGMLRGAYDIAGAAKLPSPVGNNLGHSHEQGRMARVDGEGLLPDAVVRRRPHEEHASRTGDSRREPGHMPARGR